MVRYAKVSRRRNSVLSTLDIDQGMNFIQYSIFVLQDIYEIWIGIFMGLRTGSTGGPWIVECDGVLDL